MINKLLKKLGIIKTYTVQVKKINADVVQGNIDDAWLKEAYKNMAKDEPEHYKMLKRQKAL